MSEVSMTNHIYNEALINTLVLVFTLWRALKSPNFSILKLLKGNLKCVGTFFLIFSGLSGVAYNFLLLFLNNEFFIDKAKLEDSGILNEVFKVEIGGRIINLVEVMEILMQLYSIFRISAVFIFVSLWRPTTNSWINKTRNYVFSPALIPHTSITVALYAFMRLPLSLLLHSFPPFYRSLLFGCELYAAVLLLVLTETKFSSSMPDTDNVHLLMVLLFIDGLLHHTLKIIALPFKLNQDITMLLRFATLLLHSILHILLVILFCPLLHDPNLKLIQPQKIEMEYPKDSIIEFTEFKKEQLE
ncbi:hypothetical protein TCON_0563 [Astathelohania contejeani]|uniref:Uncharacterized protein n=1 Tax=Astathelohania contejeani TaxID=164912 RepID=A0ABQ7I184_9MICR|nr:hypothetical protein TCON_0563 [Thelohania contejeani]